MPRIGNPGLGPSSLGSNNLSTNESLKAASEFEVLWGWVSCSLRVLPKLLLLPYPVGKQDNEER